MCGKYVTAIYIYIDEFANCALNIFSFVLVKNLNYTADSLMHFKNYLKKSWMIYENFTSHEKKFYVYELFVWTSILLSNICISAQKSLLLALIYALVTVR